MFNLLKDKIDSFTNKLTNKIKEKEESVEPNFDIKTENFAPVNPVSGEQKAPLEKIKETKSEKRELGFKVGLKGKIKNIIRSSVKLEEKDIDDFLFEFELSLLESDVEQETTKEIIDSIKEELLDKEIPKNIDLNLYIKEDLKQILKKTTKTSEFVFNEKISDKKPFVIMFLGPNGAGKTTSIAKLTNFLKNNDKRVVLASADTFRAGSIEQLETHAKNLNVKVIKQQYGADPAAVAFDAVKSAEASGADVVLIDTAGRQNVNKNLMEELKKINRVIKPDLKIYVGESFTGQSLLEQAETFNNEIGIDGFILTKIDSDAKGGTAISLLHKIKKPILFIGTGQTYADLLEFEIDYILDRIF